jgi:hypothetical protein
VAPGIEDEIAFISGVYPDGTLPLYAYGAWNVGTTPADYSGGYTLSEKWGAPIARTPGGTVSYYFTPSSNWNTAEQAFLAAGLALWSAIANISFVPAASAAQAQITFTRGRNGKAYTSTQTSSSPGAELTGGSILSTTTGALISIDTSVAGFNMTSASFTAVGGYPVMTFLHEEGHAIGLGHAGPYNGDANPATQQFSAYDTRLWSIMSYLEPRTTSAAYFAQYPVTGTYWGYNASGYRNEPTTWMPLDILAAQALYSLPVSTPLSGNLVFGFNSNIQGPVGQFFDFTNNVNPIVTLWSLGSNNTLDLSGFSASSTINLNPGTFSSADGMINNIAIAFGTVIDGFIGGSGSDSVLANSSGDTFRGNGGNDLFIGGSGVDTMVYSGLRSDYDLGVVGAARFIQDLRAGSPDGYDTFTGVEFLQFADMRLPLLSSGAASAQAPPDFDGDGYGDVLLRNSDGQVAIWLLDGLVIRAGSGNAGVNPGTEWRIAGRGDFNADSRSDVLLQNQNGQAAVWLMNGTQVMAGSGAFGVNPGSDWRIAGTGDFNGDGKNDLLLQNASGQAAIWFMNGLSILAGSGNAWVNPGSDWKIRGAGDFNGDGKSDVLLRNDDGRIAIWFMDNATVLAGSGVFGVNPGNDWNIAGSGDFNGDGKRDILLQNDSGQAAIWFMDGGTILPGSGNAGINPGAHWKIGGTGDFNRDGRNDVLLQNADGQAAVWLMSATTVLPGSGNIGVNPGAAWHIAAPSG